VVFGGAAAAWASDLDPVAIITAESSAKRAVGRFPEQSPDGRRRVATSHFSDFSQEVAEARLRQGFFGKAV
jgi:hypothetical protein